MKNPASGQVLVGAIVLLVILTLLIPALISYIDNEAKWSVKGNRSTRAFQLAEAGIERGYQRIIVSTEAWNTIQAGGTLAGYDFDQTYSDLSGGSYEIKISSGPGTQAVSITGVGKDTSNAELRAVRVTYVNAASNAAIYAEGGISLTSNPGVEWGPVMSPAAIISAQAHPRFYSASSVSLDGNGPVPPNSDNRQWWSYYPNLPPAPQIDVQAYIASATAQGNAYPGGTYKMEDHICEGAANCVGTFYFSGDTTLKTPAAWVTSGAIIVDGNLTLQGSAGDGTPNATLPPFAWREYGNNWAHYRATYDGAAPASFPGVNGTYTPGALTKVLSEVLVHGFLYVRDSFSINGGGNMSIWGSMYLGDPSSLDGSHVKIYYDNSLTILTKNVTLARSSWQEVTACGWAGAHATCPN